MFLLFRIKRALSKKLKADPLRMQHVKNMMKVALRLASINGVDQKKTKIACLLHDLLKLEDPIKLKELIISQFPSIDTEAFPEVTWHALGAKVYAEVVLGVSDQDILNAIMYHTTGRPGMSKLEKIVALADYIEEGRTFVGEEIRKLADEDLDKALYLSMIEITDYLANNNLPISSLTKRALEEYQQLYGGN